ncbi:MAG TPA: hypothetical protein VHQ64_18705 [Pyrinomonadaceae bacterium]|nr:hypothetical protein [Pyrinomonadaceae bacterium]
MSEVLTRVDLLEVLEEAAAIYIHIDLDDPVSSEVLDDWKNQIAVVARFTFAKEFGIPANQIELEVELLEGSLWAKIKPSLQTIVLILGLYNGVHNAAEKLPRDYEIVSEEVAEAVQTITNRTIKSIDGLWKNAELLYEMTERANPINAPNAPPQEE